MKKEKIYLYLKTIPSENGSSESMSSSSASPPSVIIWYICLSLWVMIVKPSMNSWWRCLRNSSSCLCCESRISVIWSSSDTRFRYASSCVQTNNKEMFKGTQHIPESYLPSWATSCENMASHREQIMEETGKFQIVYAGPVCIIDVLIPYQGTK